MSRSRVVSEGLVECSGVPQAFEERVEQRQHVWEGIYRWLFGSAIKSAGGGS